MRRSFLIFAIFLLPAAVHAENGIGYRLLKLDGRLVKWGSPEFGAGATLTYAFADERVSFPDARNCRSLEPVDDMLAQSGVGLATFEAEVSEAFALWTAAADVSFSRAADPSSADIIIGVDGNSEGWAHADVLTRPDAQEIGSVTRGLVCLSAARAWKVGFGAAPDAQDLRYTIAHEIGHAIGLNHPGPSGQLMSFTYGEDFSGLQPGDVDGARALYGPAPAPEAAPTITLTGARTGNSAS